MYADNTMLTHSHTCARVHTYIHTTSTITTNFVDYQAYKTMNIILLAVVTIRSK